jgi:hypothetical protein
MIVYRAIATDARPGAPAAESDTYIIEIAAPGGVAAAGFAIDDEQDRYGLSQQMVIAKTEQLIARRASMPHDSVARLASAIAAEQRAVRAEFVFMMGGELAEEVMEAAGLADLDETAEAEAEDDILAGRLANRGRLELVRAIRSMSRASAALVAVNLDKALTDEKAALTYLQGAFARARYILRALTERERLDMTRRLSGPLAGAAPDPHAARAAPRDTRAAILRRALATAAELGATAELGTTEAARAMATAQEVLRLDPSSAEYREIGLALDRGARSARSGDAGGARAAFVSAARLFASALRSALPDAPAYSRPIALEQLNGALVDELRRRR